jgi:hypothetical protein
LIENNLRKRLKIVLFQKSGNHTLNKFGENEGKEKG